MVLRTEEIPCKKAYKDLILLKLMGKKIDGGLTMPVHLNRKKNLRTERLVACFGRGWLKSRARLNEMRYTSFVGRVSNSRTASK